MVLNGAQSAKHTKHLQSTYLRACWDEHELESEIRVSPSRCSWDKQSRLLRLKHARTTAEIACYDTVISMEQLVPSMPFSPLSHSVTKFRTLQATVWTLCRKVTIAGNRTGTSQTRVCLRQNDQVGLIYIQALLMIADNPCGKQSEDTHAPPSPLRSIWSNRSRFLYAIQLLMYLNIVHVKQQRVIIRTVFQQGLFGWPGAFVNAKDSASHD